MKDGTLFHLKRVALSVATIALGACNEAADASDVDNQTQAQTTTMEDSDGGHGPCHRGPPPAEAFDACQGKEVGATCSFATDEDSVDGTCAAPPGDAPDQRVACRPEGRGGHDGGRGPHGPPPEEVFAACDGKSSGAECSVTLGDRLLEGICSEPPSGVEEIRLGCALARAPHPEEGGAPAPK